MALYAPRSEDLNRRVERPDERRICRDPVLQLFRKHPKAIATEGRKGVPINNTVRALFRMKRSDRRAYAAGVVCMGFYHFCLPYRLPTETQTVE